MPVKIRTSRRSKWWSAVLFGLVTFAFASACSLQNQEGPNVTCAQLDCGRVNACEDGIIAQCVDGVTVKFRVCGSDDVCGETWQITGQYKCTFDATDCEGCRPERMGCSDIPTGATTDASSSTSTGASGGGGNGSSSSAAGG
jgi:hypothetical protein